MRCFCAIVLTSLCAGTYAQTYTYSELPTRPGLKLTQLIGVGKMGSFALARGLDSKGNQHNLLYGPDLFSEPQDLNGSAGPYGPDTGGKLWDGNFFAVGDDGLTIAEDNKGKYYVYEHRVHTLTPLPKSLIPVGINFHGHVLGKVGQNAARWDLTDHKLTIVPFDTSNRESVDGTSYPDMSDTAVIVGYAGGFFFNSGFHFGFESYSYNPNDATATWDTSYNGGPLFWAVSSNGLLVTGQAYDGSSNSFVGTLTPGVGLSVLRLLPPTDGTYAIGTAVDSAGEVVGWESNGVGLFWDVSGNPKLIADISGGIVPLNQSAPYQIDMNGRIFGDYSDASGQNHLYVLTPATNLQATRLTNK